MLTVTTLAKRFNVTPSAVSNWLKRYGPESEAPLPRPDKPAPQPMWRADRWPEFERWNENRKLIKRGPKPENISRKPVADSPMTMDPVLDSIREVAAYARDQMRRDSGNQGENRTAGRLSAHLAVLDDFLTAIGANPDPPDASSPSGEHDETDEADMLTITQLAAELGVTKPSVQGWYDSPTQPVPFPRPVVDPPKAEGRRRTKRLWSRTQLPAARAWLEWYRPYKTRNLTTEGGGRSGHAAPRPPANDSALPPVREFLKDAKRGSGSGVRRGRIASSRVRKRHG
ncbi:hypothetical protein [Amycolatopsis rubida]|nr:hypothetical protein [Amycolatopsis rubida]